MLNSAELPWVVLVHGLTCTHEDWDPVVELLKSRCNTLTVDLRGHGQSADLPGPYKMDALASDVSALVTQLGITEAILVGHSMGTRIICSMNEQLPALAKAMVFVDGSRQAQGSAVEARETVSRLLPEDADFGAFITGMFDQMFVGSSDPASKALIIKRACSIPDPVFRELLTELLVWDAQRHPDSSKKISCPLSILQSTTINANRQRTTLEANQQIPFTDYLQREVPQAKLTVLTDTGHFSQLEAAPAIVQAIEELLL